MSALLPLPREGSLEGPAVRLSSDSTLVVGGHPDLVARILPSLGELARRTIGIRLTGSGTAPGEPRVRPAVSFELVDDAELGDLPDPIGEGASLAGIVDERYELTVGDAGATVRAAGVAGAFRGGTALLQSLEASDGIRATTGAIRDAPTFAWRGLSLDVARHFFGVEDVKRVIDLLAWHRMSVLHLHLSDSQAWRLESERWPLLTTGGTPHYSREEFRDLIRFADERFVTIVPELDMPGHTAAALAAYPELASGVEFAHPLLPYLDPEQPATLRFATDVLTEAAELTTSTFLHIGGDEAFGMPEPAYSSFVAHVLDHVHAIPRRAIGWQETTRSGALRGGAPTTSGSDPSVPGPSMELPGSEPAECVGPDLAQLWISDTDAFDAETVKARTPEAFHELVDQAAKTAAQAPGDGPRAVAAGIPLILSPSSPLYLNRPYSDASSDPAQTVAGDRLGFPDYPPESTAELADWNPFDWVAQNAAGATVAGVEAAMWGETITSFDDLALLLLPRLAIVAERAWNPASTPWESTAARLLRNAPAWERLGFGAWYRSVEIVGDRSEPTLGEEDA
ncbi:family 20 glycosylhydrolase [Rathayibacter sp. CAU 1779]